MVKEKAKGQKEILAGNLATLQFYKRMITVSVFIYAIVKWLGGFEWLDVILSVSATIGLSLVYGSMSGAANPSYSSSGALVSAGTDLNMEGGMTDYFKDLIMVTCACLLLSLISHYFWYLWLVVPGFALMKLWTSIIKPWIFAPAPETPQDMQQDTGPKKGMRQTKQKKGGNNNSSFNQPMSAFNLR